MFVIVSLLACVFTAVSAGNCKPTQDVLDNSGWPSGALRQTCKRYTTEKKCTKVKSRFTAGAATAAFAHSMCQWEEDSEDAQRYVPVTLYVCRANTEEMMEMCETMLEEEDCMGIKDENEAGACMWKPYDTTVRSVAFPDEDYACYAFADSYKEMCESMQDHDDCQSIKYENGDSACWWRPKIVDPNSVDAPCKGMRTGLNVKCAEANSEEECDAVKSIFQSKLCYWKDSVRSAQAAHVEVTQVVLVGAALSAGLLAVVAVACNRNRKAYASVTEQPLLTAA